MLDLVQTHRRELTALCRRHGVRALYLFGSAASGEFDPASSDLDFLVEFDPAARGGGLDDVYFRLRDDLMALFGRNVDLVEDTAVRNRYVRAAIDQSKVPVYAAA